MARKDRDSVILPKDVEFSCMASFQKKQTDRKIDKLAARSEYASTIILGEVLGSPRAAQGPIWNLEWQFRVCYYSINNKSLAKIVF